MSYEVIVGNLGLAYRGPSPIEAARTYGDYKRSSQLGIGRVAGESVTLFKDGEPKWEYRGTNEEQTQ